MLVATPVATDTRVLREATTLAAAGHEVHVVGKDVPPDMIAPAGVRIWSASAGAGLRVGRPRRQTEHAGSLPGRLARWLLLPEHRRRSFNTWIRGTEALTSSLSYDVVHAHDFTALAVGQRLAGRRGVPLIYDAHEWWPHRHQTGRPTPLQRRRQQRIERELGSAADAIITVGSALADTLRDTYGWRHVTVVRNSFPISSSSAVPLERPRAALYAGRLASGRDLETVAAASKLVDLPIRLLGPADPYWTSRFDSARCMIEPAVSPTQVDHELRCAGIALVTLTDRAGNHRVALPNKLFQAIQAATPIVASDVGELSRIVRMHGLGVVYRPGDPDSLVRALNEVAVGYAGFRAAVCRSSQEMSWEADASALLRIYERLDR